MWILEYSGWTYSSTIIQRPHQNELLFEFKRFKQNFQRSLYEWPTELHGTVVQLWLGWGHNTTSFEFKLACKLFPFSMVYRFQKHKVYLWEISGSASFRAIFLRQKYKGFSKFIKGKFSEPNFQFLNFKSIF